MPSHPSKPLYSTFFWNFNHRIDLMMGHFIFARFNAIVVEWMNGINHWNYRRNCVSFIYLHATVPNRCEVFLNIPHSKSRALCIRASLGLSPRWGVLIKPAIKSNQWFWNSQGSLFCNCFQLHHRHTYILSSLHLSLTSCFDNI